MSVLKKIVDQIKNANFYSINADESADVSNVEHLTFVIRWNEKNFEVHESFIGLYECDKTT